MRYQALANHQAYELALQQKIEHELALQQKYEQVVQAFNVFQQQAIVDQAEALRQAKDKATEELEVLRHQIAQEKTDLLRALEVARQEQEEGNAQAANKHTISKNVKVGSNPNIFLKV